jgi:hypothetical protein
MSAIVLDSQAFSVLARSLDQQGRSPVLNYIRAATNTDTDIVVTAAVLSEQYRGGHHDQIVDSCLGRYGGILVINTDRPLAKRIGHILAEAGRGSVDHVDASVVAAAQEFTEAMILTSDPADMTALVAGDKRITIEKL